MRISRKEGSKITIKIDGVKLEQVKQFSYLGSTITEGCKSHSKTRRRLILGKEAFNENNELLREKMKLSLKKRLIKTFYMERCIIRIKDVDNAERGNYKIGSI